MTNINEWHDREGCQKKGYETCIDHWGVYFSSYAKAEALMCVTMNLIQGDSEKSVL